MGKTKNDQNNRAVSRRRPPGVFDFSQLRSGAAPPRVEQPASRQPEPEPQQPQELDDQQILASFDPAYIGRDPKGRGAVIATGATMVRPTERNREYRGVIRIARSRSAPGYEYQGVTEWGPSGRVGSQEKVVYRGPSSDQAAQEVNKMINKKLAKGYQKIASSDQPLVNAESARIVASAMRH